MLTATGAWFTHTAEEQGGTAKTVRYRSSYFTATFSDNQGALTVVRDKDADDDGKDALEYDLVATASQSYQGTNAGEILENDLMPGDTIKAKGDLTLTFSANDGEGAWYVIGYKTVTNGVEAANYTWYSSFADGTGTAASASSLGEIKAETVLTIIAADHFVDLPTTVVNESMGTAIVLNEFVIGDVCVRMVQKENITKSEAYTYLTTGWDSPANYVAPANNDNL